MGTARHWSAVDRGMVHLVRLVLEEDWNPMTASSNLREHVRDARVLHQMAARVHRAMLDRSSEITDRAVLTLAEAIGEAQPA